jgi:hypothetical protein
MKNIDGLLIARIEESKYYVNIRKQRKHNN